MDQTKTESFEEAVKLALKLTPLGGWMAFHYVETDTRLEPWHVNDSSCPCHPFAIQRRPGQTAPDVIRAYKLGRGN